MTHRGVEQVRYGTATGSVRGPVTLPEDDPSDRRPALVANTCLPDQNRSMVGTEVVEYLVLTDRGASDDVDFYPQRDPVAGRSSLSVPLRSAPLGGVRCATAHTAADGATIETNNGILLWAGHLYFSTGDVILADWSMQEQRQVQVRPGTYAVAVGTEESGVLVVTLARA